MGGSAYFGLPRGVDGDFADWKKWGEIDDSGARARRITAIGEDWFQNLFDIPVQRA